MYHIPVLLNECVEGLNINPDGIYVDVTFGSGGHSRGILEKLSPAGKLVAFDRDQDVTGNLPEDDRFIFIQENYRYLKNFLKFHGITQIDGLLADLGISSWQIDQPGRGFSTRSDGKLDMRMDQNQENTAAHIINTYSADRLTKIFHDYGEINNARRLTEIILAERARNNLKTTGQFKETIIRMAPKGRENQFLAKVFQAIRIEVNEELDSLRDLLTGSQELLSKGGRLVIIAYHSLEDRLVKNYFRTGNFEGIPVKDFFGKQIAPLMPVNRKAIIPSESEQKANPRSRSARLRIAEKI